VSGWLFKRKKN